MSNLIIEPELPNIETAFLVTDPPKQLSIFDMSPKGKIVYATEIANELYKVIEKQKLYSNIQGKKYIKAEGWATLGTMLNVLPKEERVIEQEDGSFEAWVNLISPTGMVVGGASALCGMDEARWRSANRYARRSMAITRATGKAYRLTFAFIPAMAGYEVTPAEEMPTYEPHEKKPLPFYEETPDQAQILKTLCETFGTTDKKEMREISNAMKGVAMEQLAEKVKKYIESPLEN